LEHRAGEQRVGVSSPSWRTKSKTAHNNDIIPSTSKANCTLKEKSMDNKPELKQLAFIGNITAFTVITTLFLQLLLIELIYIPIAIATTLGSHDFYIFMKHNLKLYLLCALIWWIIALILLEEMYLFQ
jgi:hypothetical protein